MKKTQNNKRNFNLIYILVIAMAFCFIVLTGCGGSGNDITSPSSDGGSSVSAPVSDGGSSVSSSDSPPNNDGPSGPVLPPMDPDDGGFDSADADRSTEGSSDPPAPQDQDFEQEGVNAENTGGYYLDPDEYDLLVALPLPITNDQWDTFFLSKNGNSAGRTTQGVQEASWFVWENDCKYEVTVAFTSRRNNNTPASVSWDNGTYKHFRSVVGPAHSLSVAAPKASVSVNCFAGPWDYTEIGYGLDIIEYAVTYRLVIGDESYCDYDPDTLAEVEAIYKSNMWARTWVGFWSPFCTRISNAYAVDRAQAIFNGTTLFDIAGGAQSGDSVSSTISITMGGQFSSQSGLTGSASISSSETRVKNSGTAEDALNGFGKGSSTADSGWIVLNTGGKAFARHDGRAGARSRTLTDNAAIYIVVTVDGHSVGLYAQVGGNTAQMQADRTGMMQPFFEARGLNNYPPS